MTEKTAEQSEYPEVRVLTRKDRKKLSELIKAFAERSGSSELTKMIPGTAKAKPEGDAEKDEGDDETAEKTYELIKTVMDGLLTWVEEDVTTWFMDLVGVKDKEAYDNLPFDIEVYIVDSLIKQKGFNNFFLRLSALYRKVRGSIG